MKAMLKGLHSPDVDNLQNFQPEEEDNFSILFQLMVGPSDSEGEEAFGVQVCTPLWLLTESRTEDVLIGRGLLIMRQYNYNKIANTFSRFCESCTGRTWEEVATKVSRIGFWEFEDYRE